MLIWIIAEEYGGRLAAAGRRLKEEDLGLSFAGETLCAVCNTTTSSAAAENKVDREDLKTS